MVTLREMTKEDIEICSDIYFNAFHKKTEEKLNDMISEIYANFKACFDFVNYFSAFINRKDRYAICLQNDNKVVGYITAVDIPSLTDGRTIYIDSFAVDPEYQRKGIGENGLKEFMDRFPEKYAKRLITERKIPAYKLYQKLGFRDMDMCVMEQSLSVDMIKALEEQNKKLDEEIKTLEKAIAEKRNEKSK